MDKELEELLLFFKDNKESHSKKADKLITQFVINLDEKEKKQIGEIVLYFHKKNTKYYKNYSAAQFVRAYIFNKNNGRDVGSLTDYIQHYKKRYCI